MIPTEPQYDILTSRKPRNLFLAGQGSGKTHIAGAVTAIFISNFPNVRGLIAANTHDQLNRSTLFRIREVWEHDFGIREYNEATRNGCYVIDKKPPKHFITKGHNFKSYNNIISFDNGCVIYIGSLENYKALDGIEIAWAILDETKDTKEEAVKEVITGRLRQPGMYVTPDGKLTGTPTSEPFNPLYVFTSPAKVQWLNEWFKLDEYEEQIRHDIHVPGGYFRMEVANRLITISSTYLNAKNLPSNYIENRMSDIHSGLIEMLIYGNPFSKAGGEFYKCFEKKRNVADTKYDPHLPLWLTWDFNVMPYVTCNVWQFDGKKGWQIDEICLKSPTNRTIDVCNEFIKRYPGHMSGVFITGDPSGKQEDTRSEAGHNDFNIITKALAKYKPQKRVASIAPSVVMRANFINTIFEKGFDGIELYIGRHCINTVNDYTYLKEAADGTKLKNKVTDPDTKQSYEQYGHTSDANDYVICQVFAAEFARFKANTSSSNTKPKMGTSTSNKYAY